MPRAFVAAAIAGKTAVASNAPFLAECGITSLPGVRSGITDREELRELCAAVDVGITSADYVLADTGTLVMLSSPREARLISLLPPAHIAVVPRERILTGLDELFTVLPQPAARNQLHGADHRPQPHRRYRADPGARRARPRPDHRGNRRLTPARSIPYAKADSDPAANPSVRASGSALGGIGLPLNASSPAWRDLAHQSAACAGLRRAVSSRAKPR